MVFWHFPIDWEAPKITWPTGKLWWKWRKWKITTDGYYWIFRKFMVGEKNQYQKPTLDIIKLLLTKVLIWQTLWTNHRTNCNLQPENSQGPAAAAQRHGRPQCAVGGADRGREVPNRAVAQSTWWSPGGLLGVSWLCCWLVLLVNQVTHYWL